MPDWFWRRKKERQRERHKMRCTSPESFILFVHAMSRRRWLLTAMLPLLRLFGRGTWKFLPNKSARSSSSLELEFSRVRMPLARECRLNLKVISNRIVSVRHFTITRVEIYPYRGIGIGGNVAPGWWCIGSVPAIESVCIVFMLAIICKFG